MSAYLRIQPASRPTADLLDEANWVSRIWDYQGQTKRCETCRGVGDVRHACEDPADCYRDHDDPMDTDPCDDCAGRGEVEDSERRGVSVCLDEHDLYLYFRDREADLRDVIIVELEGDYADDEDFDADTPGDPFLIFPTRVVGTRDATDLVARIRDYNEE